MLPDLPYGESNNMAAQCTCQLEGYSNGDLNFLQLNSERTFALVYREIGYFTTREVKSWPVQNTRKLPPEPKARVAKKCSGVALFISPYCVCIVPGPKIPHSRFGAGSESGIFARVW